MIDNCDKSFLKAFSWQFDGRAIACKSFMVVVGKLLGIATIVTLTSKGNFGTINQSLRCGKSASKILMTLASIVVFLGAVIGCQPPKSSEQFNKENPFNTDQKVEKLDFLMVTCDFANIELAGSVDMTSRDYWKMYSISSANRPNISGVVEGFDPGEVAVWNENGFEIAIIPMSRWIEIQANLKRAGAVESPAVKSIFMNSAEVSWIPAYGFDEPRSVFVHESGEAIRGYTLENGECSFRLQCMPWQKSPWAGKVKVEIVPVFRSYKPTGRVLETKAGFTQEYVEIVFDAMSLSGVLRNDYIICIASKKRVRPVSNLGELFFDRNGRMGHTQLLTILAPRSYDAREVRVYK